MAHYTAFSVVVEIDSHGHISQVFSKTPALDTTKVYWARRRGEHSRLERTAKTRAEVGGGGGGEEAGAGRAGSNALCCWGGRPPPLGLVLLRGVDPPSTAAEGGQPHQAPNRLLLQR